MPLPLSITLTLGKMRLENINCEYIKVSPFAYEHNWNNSTLKELILTGIYNEGTPISKSINLVTTSSKWRVDLTYTSLMYISEINIKNIFTNQVYNLVDTPLPVTSENMITIALAVQTFLHTTFGEATASVTADYTTVTSGYFIVTGLPYNLVMDSAVVTLSGVEKSTPFTFVPTADVIVNQDSIFIKPSFFGQTVFQDGIYNITSDTISIDNKDVREQVCIFVDCSLSARLYQAIDITKCDPHDMNLLMIHYTLTQASNKACDCDGMYELYNYLVNNITSVITEGCGC